MELVYGVMVTQLFLVQSFKVRVLVDQQKTPQEIEEFFYFEKVVIYNFKLKRFQKPVFCKKSHNNYHNSYKKVR